MECQWRKFSIHIKPAMIVTSTCKFFSQHGFSPYSLCILLFNYKWPIHTKNEALFVPDKLFSKCSLLQMYI